MLCSLYFTLLYFISSFISFPPKIQADRHSNQNYSSDNAHNNARKTTHCTVYNFFGVFLRNFTKAIILGYALIAQVVGQFSLPRCDLPTTFWYACRLGCIIAVLDFSALSRVSVDIIGGASLYATGCEGLVRASVVAELAAVIVEIQTVLLALLSCDWLEHSKCQYHEY